MITRLIYAPRVHGAEFPKLEERHFVTALWWIWGSWHLSAMPPRTVCEEKQAPQEDSSGRCAFLSVLLMQGSSTDVVTAPTPGLAVT